MAGDDHVASFGEIAARLARRNFDPREFDRRPGVLEATRGLDPAPCAVVGRCNGELRVALLVRGEITALTPEQALALAAGLHDAAMLLTEGYPP